MMKGTPSSHSKTSSVPFSPNNPSTITTCTSTTPFYTSNGFPCQPFPPKTSPPLRQGQRETHHNRSQAKIYSTTIPSKNQKSLILKPNNNQQRSSTSSSRIFSSPPTPSSRSKHQPPSPKLSANKAHPTMTMTAMTLSSIQGALTSRLRMKRTFRWQDAWLVPRDVIWSE